MIEITDSLKNETTAWADQVIERFKAAMRSGETYLRWNEPLMYRKGGDAWVDESWWIETAKEIFAKQDRKHNINHALEILVYHYPEQFKTVALDRIEKWCKTNPTLEFFVSYNPVRTIALNRIEELYKEHGDTESWYDLIAATNSCHPVLIDLLNYPDSPNELAFLANLGHLKAINDCRSLIIDCLTKVDLSSVWKLFHRLDKKLVIEILSERQIEQIKSLATEIASKKSEFEDYEHFSILYPAIKLEWEKVVVSLSENPEFLGFYREKIIFWGGYNIFYDRMILEWSFSSRKDLTQQLVLLAKKVIDVSPFLDEINTNPSLISCLPMKLTEQDKLDKAIQFAIAWKRSLET
jgi:hypothetical protein